MTFFFVKSLRSLEIFLEKRIFAIEKQTGIRNKVRTYLITCNPSILIKLKRWDGGGEGGGWGGGGGELLPQLRKVRVLAAVAPSQKNLKGAAAHSPSAPPLNATLF